MNWALVIFIIIACFVLLFITDYILGKKNHELHNKKRNYPKRIGNIELFTNGKKLYSCMFKELKAAQSSIHVLLYTLKNDKISNEFLQILLDKSKQGIEVRLLLDCIGSISVSKSKVKQLKQAGANVSFCHRPRFPFLLYSLLQRNHRKVTIIDGKIGYLGGFNISKQYVNKDNDLNPWRDFHLKVLGQSVKDLQDEFLFNWFQSTNISLEENPKYFAFAKDIDTSAIDHQIIATEGIRLEKEICDVIQKTKKEITIVTPYFIPSPSVQKELMRALERGVSLTILVPEHPDHPLVKEASYRFFRILLKNGASIYQYTNGFLHAKMMIFDQTLCNIGSSNFDQRSFHLNSEMNCFLYEQTFIEKMQQVVKDDIAVSHKLTLEELQSLKWSTKLKEWITIPLNGIL